MFRIHPYLFEEDTELNRRVSKYATKLLTKSIRLILEQPEVLYSFADFAIDQLNMNENYWNMIDTSQVQVKPEEEHPELLLIYNVDLLNLSILKKSLENTLKELRSRKYITPDLFEETVISLVSLYWSCIDKEWYTYDYPSLDKIEHSKDFLQLMEDIKQYVTDNDVWFDDEEELKQHVKEETDIVREQLLFIENVYKYSSQDNSLYFWDLDFELAFFDKPSFYESIIYLKGGMGAIMGYAVNDVDDIMNKLDISLIADFMQGEDYEEERNKKADEMLRARSEHLDEMLQVFKFKQLLEEGNVEKLFKMFDEMISNTSEEEIDKYIRVLIMTDLGYGVELSSDINMSVNEMEQLIHDKINSINSLENLNSNLEALILFKFIDDLSMEQKRELLKAMVKDMCLCIMGEK